MAVGIEIYHATIKNAQTIGMVESSYAKLNKILKTHVNAIMVRNTLYHGALEYSTTKMFHGCTPYNALELKYLNPAIRLWCRQQNAGPNKRKILNKLCDIDNIVAAHRKHKAYYFPVPRNND